MYTRYPALSELDYSQEGVHWLHMDDNQQSILAFARRSNANQWVVFVANWTPQVYYDYDVPVPAAGTWKEILNSDSTEFGGSGVVASDKAFSRETDKGSTIQISIPPFGASFWLLEQ